MVVLFGGVFYVVNFVIRKIFWLFVLGLEMFIIFMVGREKEIREINFSLEDGFDVEIEDWFIFIGLDGKLYV